MVSACKTAGSPVKAVTVSVKGSDSKGSGAAHSAAMSAGAVAAVAFGAIVALA